VATVTVKTGPVEDPLGGALVDAATRSVQEE